MYPYPDTGLEEYTILSEISLSRTDIFKNFQI